MYFINSPEMKVSMELEETGVLSILLFPVWHNKDMFHIRADPTTTLSQTQNIRDSVLVPHTSGFTVRIIVNYLDSVSSMYTYMDGRD